MKYYKRLDIWKASNVSFDPVTYEARSYGWWIFVRKIKGRVVFNNYHYSKSTSKHQSKVLRLLNSLGIKIDIFVSMRESLNTFEINALYSSFERIGALQEQIETRGSRRELNHKRQIEIEGLNKHIKELRALGAKIQPKTIKIAMELGRAGIKNRRECKARRRVQRQKDLVIARAHEETYVPAMNDQAPTPRARHLRLV